MRDCELCDGVKHPDTGCDKCARREEEDRLVEDWDDAMSLVRHLEANSEWYKEAGQGKDYEENLVLLGRARMREAELREAVGLPPKK